MNEQTVGVNGTNERREQRYSPSSLGLRVRLPSLTEKLSFFFGRLFGGPERFYTTTMWKYEHGTAKWFVESFLPNLPPIKTKDGHELITLSSAIKRKIVEKDKYKGVIESATWLWMKDGQPVDFQIVTFDQRPPIVWMMPGVWTVYAYELPDEVKDDVKECLGGPTFVYPPGQKNGQAIGFTPTFDFIVVQPNVSTEKIGPEDFPLLFGLFVDLFGNLSKALKNCFVSKGLYDPTNGKAKFKAKGMWVEDVAYAIPKITGGTWTPIGFASSDVLVLVLAGIGVGVAGYELVKEALKND